MRTTKSSIELLLGKYFTWKIPSLYFNFTPIMFNILIDNLYDDILQLKLDPLIQKIFKYSKLVFFFVNFNYFNILKSVTES